MGGGAFSREDERARCRVEMLCLLNALKIAATTVGRIFLGISMVRFVPRVQQDENHIKWTCNEERA